MIITDEELVPPYELPDPLVFADDRQVTTAAEWRERRREIMRFFAEHVYGVTPAGGVESSASVIEADALAHDGTALRRQERLLLSRSGASLAIDVLSYRPAAAPAPLPAIIVPNFRGNHTVTSEAAVRISARARRDHTDGSSERASRAHQFPLESILARGYQISTFYYGDVATDAVGAEGGAAALFGSVHAPQDWGAVGAWAWGASRVLDHLATDDGIDSERVFVAGHSRLGKAALWAAAQDERFAGVFANDSGCTGAAIARRRFGETVAAINDLFPHWFCRAYHDYGEREDLLPVDQHELIAAIAPRPVYVASAAEDLWADPRGEYLGALHAAPVYRLLGFDGLTIAQWPPAGAVSRGRVGYHLRPGGHDLLAVDWMKFLDFRVAVELA